MFLIFIPGHKIKLPFFIALENVHGCGYGETAMYILDQFRFILVFVDDGMGFMAHTFINGYVP